MITLKIKIRKEKGKKVKKLRKAGWLPAILYGPKIKENILLEISQKEFKGVYLEAGHSSLISLEVEGQKKNYLVLIGDVSKGSLAGEITHVDFYQPDLEKKVQVKVPLVLEGEAPAVKELAGTLVQNIYELEMKAFPQNLPKEVRVSALFLKTFEDRVLVKDIKLPEGTEILRNQEDVVAQVVPPVKVEEELAKPAAEEKVEVEVVGKEKKEEGEAKEEEPVASENKQAGKEKKETK